MNKAAKWIWYPGEFEAYHHKLLSYRRKERGCDYPCCWYVPNTELSVRFFSKFTAEKDTVLRVVTHSNGMVRMKIGDRPVNCDIMLEKGDYDICVELFDLDGFCSIYIDNEYIVTDESWTCDIHDSVFVNAACEPAYHGENADPKVFPFEYERVYPVSEEELPGGTLYDFGRELFGIVEFESIPEGTVLIYGESREEALDFKEAIIREVLYPADEKRRQGTAFRYLFIGTPGGEKPAFSVEYEYLPIEDKASFTCDRETVNKIFDFCAYTFHLNSREFYLDGIKRDRWVWSGDAYQSYMINNYLYFDKGMTTRTITALLGKPPFKTHINTINDYSAYQIISVLDYYKATGDKEFVKSVWSKIKSLYSFITSRLDERGYVVKRYGDWIFVDWGDVDKDGAVCAEQILLHRVYASMGELSALLGESGDYAEKAEILKKKIIRDFWREDKGAFIDSFDSEKEHISRQSNVFAVLYDMVDPAAAERICANVFENNAVTPITTPYFKLYELMAMCRLGRIEQMQDYLESYWGGMLALGATSVWEQYDPKDEGTAHYAMYGGKYAKSLCHAWGSGPILLLGRYCCGVYSTSVGYKTFNVEPKPGRYSRFSAKVPVAGGVVSVEYENGKVTACADVDGGTLIFGGKEAAMPKNIPVSL